MARLLMRHCENSQLLEFLELALSFTRVKQVQKSRAPVV
jgi:hypothetical protein